MDKDIKPEYLKRQVTGSTRFPIRYVPCTRQEYEDWLERCKNDPFYATSHAEEFKKMYPIDLDDGPQIPLRKKIED